MQRALHRDPIKNLSITGGSFVQNNRHHTALHYDYSQNFHTQNEKNVFNGSVYGFIHTATAETGPINAYKQEMKTSHQDESSAKVPRSLKASKQSTPLAPIRTFKGESAHYNPLQSTHHKTRNRVQNRDIDDNLGHSILTGGDHSSSRASHHGLPPIDLEAEILQLSPKMQGFLINLQNTYCERLSTPVKRGRKEKASHRVDSSQRTNDFHCHSRDEICTEDEPDVDDGDEPMHG